MPSANQIGSTVYYALLTVYGALLLVLFLRRTDREPIRSRSPQAGIVGAVFVNLVALLQVVRTQVPIPCGFTDLLYQVVWSTAVASYFFRVVALLHSFERHQRIARRAARKDNNRKQETEIKVASETRESMQEKPQFYSQSPWRAMSYYAAFKSVFAVLVIITASVDAAGQSWTRTEADCTVWGTATSVLGDAAIVIFFVWLMRRNRVHDPFLITTELKMTVWMGILTMGPWGLLWVAFNYGRLGEQDFIFAKLFVILTFTLAAQTLQLGYPLYYTYVFSSGGGEKVKRAKLLTVLFSPSHREKFFQFLLSEWSSENLHFWEAVNEWTTDVEQIEVEAESRSLANVNKAMEKAQEIFDVYIDPNDAEYQVNLPSRLISPLTSFFKENKRSTDGKPGIEKGIEMGESKEDGPSRSKETRYAQRNDHKQQQAMLKLGNEASPGTSQDAFMAHPEAASYMKERVDLEMNALRTVKMMLAKAKRVIFQLMERDSYNRFCTTDEGRQIMREVEALKLERKASEAGVA
eukprot:CAMPEP_0185273070 /NCGR_PEP_ID=MMETSP1359-20130426/48693_1 /TAXON_ID=552665 /ORGANISM="Bigelowiella longifila, Strain CCMP242" /LENGTH=521 /DNA_ID=CAMNT_0027865571 /DNA_START=45 /DNA_END=1610 /DNA_ORIENTATION=+